MPVDSEAPVRLVPVLGQLAFVVVAALFVYGFVAVTKEGETRRVCSAPCFLHPDYLAAIVLHQLFEFRKLLPGAQNVIDQMLKQQARK